MRKVKDAVDLTTNEKIYFKGHAKATYLSDGNNVEDTMGGVAEAVMGIHENLSANYATKQYVQDALAEIPTAESSVFEAKYGVTTFAEIVEARNKGKEVLCKYDDKIARVTLFSDSVLVFEVTFGTLVHRFVCYSDNNWDSVDFDNAHELKTLANGNAKITIAGKTAEVATLQYVENAIQQSDSLISDWNAKEGESGYIKNKPYEIFKSRIEKVDNNTLRVKIAEDEYSGNYSVTGHYIKWSNSLYKLQHDETNLEIGDGRDILYVIYDKGDYYLTHSRNDADSILSYFVDYPEENSIFYVVNGIDGIYLTDNVVKTIPQKLSGNAKSQVLENLGLGEVATKQELTELSAEVGKKVDADFVNNAIAEAIATTLNEEV